jgi:predicted RNA-binding protein with PUA-like domain
MKYWLFKTEPDEYSINDLANAGPTGAPWDGIRNYQARNFLRDDVAVGDRVLIYHSSCATVGLVGVARVVKAAYADPDQFDANSNYFDAKATPDNPRWYRVDIIFVARFDELISLAQLKATHGLESMVLLRQGRLSVQPVTANEWKIIHSLARIQT